MSDLVERLRKLTGDVPPHGHVTLAVEAAARIEALEAALRQIKPLVLANGRANQIIRAALAGKIEGTDIVQ